MNGKRLVAMVLVVLSVLLVSTTAFAGAPAAPQYSHVFSIAASIELKAGVLTGIGVTEAYPANQDLKVRTYTYLQRKERDLWVTVANWSDVRINARAVASGTYTATKGYEYRTFVVGQVSTMEGAVLERVTKLSKVISY